MQTDPTGLGVGQDTRFIHLSCLSRMTFNQFAQICIRIPTLSATPGNNSKTRYDKFKPYLIINWKELCAWISLISLSIYSSLHIGWMTYQAQLMAQTRLLEMIALPYLLFTYSSILIVGKHWSLSLLYPITVSLLWNTVKFIKIHRIRTVNPWATSRDLCVQN